MAPLLTSANMVLDWSGAAVGPPRCEFFGSPLRAKAWPITLVARSPWPADRHAVRADVEALGPPDC